MSMYAHCACMPTVLFNSETWHNLKKTVIDQLEKHNESS